VTLALREAVDRDTIGATANEQQERVPDHQMPANGGNAAIRGPAPDRSQPLKPAEKPEMSVLGQHTGHP